MALHRRLFLKQVSALSAAGVGAEFLSNRLVAAEPQEPLYKISLAEWSLHRALQQGKLDNRDFAKVAKNDFGIEAIEYLNQFFQDKAKDKSYLIELKKRAEDLGVKSLLIVIDGEGRLGDADEQKRTQAVENHYKWVEAAQMLGCHSIRANTFGDGNFGERVDRAADGLRMLTEFAEKHDMNVLVENTLKSRYSSLGGFLTAVVNKVGMKHCGTLPDFAGWGRGEGVDADYRYKGVAGLMPFAKAVSARSDDFDAQGNETHTDYRQMMKIVVDAGYHGYVGIKYEGGELGEPEGIKATKKLLEQVRNELTNM